MDPKPDRDEIFVGGPRWFSLFLALVFASAAASPWIVPLLAGRRLPEVVGDEPHPLRFTVVSHSAVRVAEAAQAAGCQRFARLLRVTATGVRLLAASGCVRDDRASVAVDDVRRQGDRVLVYLRREAHESSGDPLELPEVEVRVPREDLPDPERATYVAIDVTPPARP